MKEKYDFNEKSFQFAPVEGRLHDLKLETKPLNYFQDAFLRFKKNKASVVAAVIIGILVLFAILAPIFSPYTVAYNDSNYRYVLPRSKLAYEAGWNFWDGCTNKSMSKDSFYYYYSMGVETGHNAVKNQEFETETTSSGVVYNFRFDTYNAVGMVYMSVNLDTYTKIQKYQDETGIQIIYPITVKELRPKAVQDMENANYWYKTDFKGGKTAVVLDENGNFIDIYKAYSGDDGYTSTARIEGEGNYEYDYAVGNQTGFQIRVNYREYYIYYHTTILQDRISEPLFLFGATTSGQDIFTCLGSGARFSFLLALVVAGINLFVGAIYGAVEGYYGGAADLVMERIADILGSIPTMIVIVLLKLHMANTSHLLLLFITFFLTGWMGMAGRVRMQFYRFKNSEYVLAARTLGAKDGRLMFKHIFPNSLGTIITGSVLVIPGVIFTESSLSYLGIINLNTGNMTSVGTLLANAQPQMTTYPHMIFFPALFISLLMLSFNLFGNGLRDAFNPSLRGTED